MKLKKKEIIKALSNQLIDAKSLIYDNKRSLTSLEIDLKKSQARCKKLDEERDSYIKEIAKYKDFESKIIFPLISEKETALETENTALKQQIINQNKRIEKMRDLAYKIKVASETVIDESLPF